MKVEGAIQLWHGHVFESHIYHGHSALFTVVTNLTCCEYNIFLGQGWHKWWDFYLGESMSLL